MHVPRRCYSLPPAAAPSARHRLCLARHRCTAVTARHPLPRPFGAEPRPCCTSAPTTPCHCARARPGHLTCHDVACAASSHPRAVLRARACLRRCCHRPRAPHLPRCSHDFGAPPRPVASVCAAMTPPPSSLVAQVTTSVRLRPPQRLIASPPAPLTFGAHLPPCRFAMAAQVADFQCAHASRPSDQATRTPPQWPSPPGWL